MTKPVLSPRFLRQLAAENPLGLPLTEQDVRDWWDYIWPVYRDRGYRDHKRAIKRWWQRVEGGELDRARERAHNLRVRAARQAIEAQGEPNVVDLYSRLQRA